MVSEVEAKGRVSRWVPRGGFEGLADQLADLLFQGAVVDDAPATFAGLGGGEGLGGAFTIQEAGPAVIGAVELGRFSFAGTVGFAAGGADGGEAAGQEGQSDVEGDLSWIFALHSSNVYIR